MPQHRFASIHIVGTNGKSSVAEMAGALLEAHGRRTGVYLSPHTERWSERVRIGGAEIDAGEFAAAAERVAQSVEVVNRALEEGESVTQFEAATATAFVALASAGVELGVIEAGLGGRLDATNVLPSRATALTSVGLEHTEWLGETEEEIAAEKLAVLARPLDPGAGQGRRRGARAGRAGGRRAKRPSDRRRGCRPEIPARRPGRLPAAKLRGRHWPPPRRSSGGSTPTGWRPWPRGSSCRVACELLTGDPPLILDAAHNPDGARALAEALPEAAGEAPVVACLAILADKDAAGVLAALAPRLDVAVCTELPAERLARAGRPGARSLEAARLAELAEAAGMARTEVVGRPEAALRRAVAAASERGGVTLVTGSHYLLGYASGARLGQLGQDTEASNEREVK